MSIDKARMNELRLKRQKLAEVRESKRLRDTYGAKLASVVSTAINRPLTLDDFHEELEAPMRFEAGKLIHEARGLVASYIAKPSAADLLLCFEERLGLLNGKLGFEGKAYMGLAEVSRLKPVSLLHVADELEESVLLYLDNPSGIIFVECYITHVDEPYSIVVQGEGLIEVLSPCFNEHLNKSG
jgi:hypothetical protein